MKILVSEEYKELSKNQSFSIFKWYGIDLLKENIEPFFNCEVEFCFSPVDEAKERFNISLLDNPKRGCYPIDENNFFIYARILKANKLLSGIGLLMKGRKVSDNKRVFNDFEGALTRTLSKLYSEWFKNSTLVLGDALITHTIANYCAKGRIDYRNFEHLITYFHKLSGTTFEGRPFSTGLIVTKSFGGFKRRGDETRHGKVYDIRNVFTIKNSLKIERRLWFLVDGKNSFYIANKALDVKSLFVIGESYSELGYVDNNSLSLTLKTNDTLFRIENEKQFSIISSDGIEFVYLENRWRIRNYNIIKGILSSHLDSVSTINSLLFFIIYCSKNSISSVIWIPENANLIHDSIKEGTLNQLISEDISIADKNFANQIIRCLSSDGATIISKNGYLSYFGCIVELSKMNVQGIRGTGESAAQLLAKNGVAFKISQDGTIKLFTSDSAEPILI